MLFYKEYEREEYEMAREQAQRMKSWIYVFGAGCLWGTQGFFVKMMERYGSTSFYTSFLRMFLGFLLLVVITLVREGKEAFRIDRKTLLSCVLLGLVSQAAYNVAYSTAITEAGVAVAAILLYTAPVFTAVFSFLFFREEFNRWKGAALALNILGCVLTVTGGRVPDGTIAAAGILAGLAAGICYGLTPIFGRIASGESVSPFVLATYNFLFASLFLGIFTRPWETVESPVEPHMLGFGILLALVPTVFSYLLYFTALREITETAKVPVVASVEAVVATLLGVFLFRETFGGIHIIGIVLVMISIAVTSLYGSKAEEGRRSR